MRTTTLIRWGAIAAMLAGALRAVASFIPWPAEGPGVGLELFYMLIDILLLLGLPAIYARIHEKTGVLGFTGFLAAFIGTASIIGPDGKIGAVDLYMAGSMLITIGLTMLAIACLRAGALGRLAPALWVVSTIVGVGGFATGGPAVTFVIAGLTFGLAYALAGAHVWNELRSERG
ncbi:MAG: hypothetical protein ACKV2V_22315 [Blastocatellia bacterium]